MLSEVQNKGLLDCVSRWSVIVASDLVELAQFDSLISLSAGKPQTRKDWLRGNEATSNDSINLNFILSISSKGEGRHF